MLRTGEVTVMEVPPPIVPDRGALVSVSASVVSSGTERAKVEIGNKSLLSKAQSKPDAVRQTIDLIRQEGLKSAADLVRTRLDAPQELGYSCSGVVEEVGPYGGPVTPGTRVACAGGGYANHASAVAVPRNLMASVPDEVSDEAAAYATLGAIALHGVRQAEVGFGDRILVVGLGLIGQLTCQLASAAGAVVHGLDPEPGKVEMAERTASICGGTALEELESLMGRGSAGYFDAVLITATSKSNQPIDVASASVRDRGRIVVVGDVGLDLDREPMYEKEVDLRFSRSYGPGRYDPSYEVLGFDYPPSYVRWTVQRNMSSFLQACASGRIDPTVLTTHTFTVDDAGHAYDLLSKGDEFSVGVVLTYPQTEVAAPLAVKKEQTRSTSRKDQIRIGVIGTGQFATRRLLPILKKHPHALITAVASERGLSSGKVASEYRAEAVQGIDEMLSRNDVDAVVIATRHDSHARIVREALLSGLHVFVEKPLTRAEDELDDVLNAYRSSPSICMVGFNRRYAQAAAAVREEMSRLHGPMQILIRVNAGPLADHWLADPEVGGGRLVGEGCHFVDLAGHLVGRPASGALTTGVPRAGKNPAGWEDFSITLDYPNGSTATILYSSLGNTRLPKEIVEVHRAGVSAVIDDFRTWRLWEDGKKRSGGGRKADKGHGAELNAFIEACRGNEPPLVSFESDVVSTVTTFAALRSVGLARRVEVPEVTSKD